MTKISTYTLDEKITALDKWIGSDVNNHNRTKNFTPKKLAEYFNDNQVINIGTGLQYKYYTLDPNETRPPGTLSFENEIGPEVNFSSITTFLLSKYTEKGNEVSEFLNFLDKCKVLIYKSSDINLFGFYKISDIAIYDENPNFYVISVDFQTGNGGIKEDEDYLISLVSLPVDGDKTDVFVQSVPALVWNINHNLKKYPSVSVVNINNVLMYGNTTYIDENNLQIEFSAEFSGKAYMN
jgi:hypothetical protein